jgi:1-acyl-sn-glycerol-3-phosphate acyltransferase
MLSFLPPFIRGMLCTLLIVLNAILLPMCISLFAVLRWLMPVKRWQQGCYTVMHALSQWWADANYLALRWCHRIKWHVTGVEGLDKKAWYFLVANHQSWSDIFVLYAVFNHKAPALKFFLKQQLIWIPFIGLACKSLHFPFMYRHSKSELKKHPEKKHKDIEATKRSCEAFKYHPSTIVLFPEATRFTQEKQQAQKSAYQHLLSPKGGMLSLSLSLLGGDYIRHLIDVTIQYNVPNPTMWDFLSGKVNTISVTVDCLPLPDNLVKLPQETSQARQQVQLRKHAQAWLNALWQSKDERLKEKSKQT